MEGDEGLEKRIKAGYEAVDSKVAFFQKLFGNVESRWKSDRSRVTEADLTISREIEKQILGAFPEDQFFSEETQELDQPVSLTAEFVWIIDPVDGTNNFALGMAMCAISLGLLRNGMPVYGFVYDASRRLIMHGGKGCGAFEGENMFSPSQRRETDELFAAFDGFSSGGVFDLLVALRGKGIKVRNVGSGTLHLAYTANGLLDGSFSNRVHVWDIAAAYAFCQAVGSEVHFFNDSLFPLTAFDLKAPRVYYYAGTSVFCRKVEKIWKEAGVFPSNGITA